jgi:hypothetical protein
MSDNTYTPDAYQDPVEDDPNAVQEIARPTMLGPDEF